MTWELYRYEFQSHVSMAEVESSLLLALLATECLHGESQVRLDASHFLDPEKCACVIDARTPVGQDINRLFVGFLRHEFGEGSFTIQRTISHSKHQPEEVSTQ